jgi:hypothetical protein
MLRKGIGSRKAVTDFPEGESLIIFLVLKIVRTNGGSNNANCSTVLLCTIIVRTGRF